MTKKPKKQNKVSRIVFRCLPEDYELIQKASDLDGRKMPDFLRFHIKEVSRAILLKNDMQKSVPAQTDMMKTLLNSISSLNGLKK